MKKNYLLFITIISLLIMSCSGSFFNPRYYYNKGNSSSIGGGTEPTPPPTPPEPIPEDQDPFKKEPYNDPDYAYPAENFDKWLFKVSFQGDKLPIYEFFEEKDRNWLSGGSDWKQNSADYYQARDGENKVYGTLVGTVNITGMKIYRYNKSNPLYDNSGYLEGRMDRFRFYSIDGKASVTTLKQYLIAVDTYSKFVFAYGAITKVDNVAGELVPADFQAIEYYAEKIHFYEYDPIGYVDSTGKVILYEHYKKEFVQSPTTYVPKRHGYDNVAEHNPLKQGHSPYIVISDEEASEDDKQKYYDNISNLVGKEYLYRDYSGYVKNANNEKGQIDLADWVSKGYSGKSLVLYKYSLSDNGDTFTILEEHFNSSSSSSKQYKINLINSADKAFYTNVADENDKISISIVEYNGENTISISGNVLDPNFKDYGPIFVDRVRNTYFKRDGTTSIGGGIGGIASSTFPLSIGGKLKDLEYTFNQDGTEFTMKYTYDDGGIFTTKWVTVEYHFKLARFDSDADKHWTAKYECLDLSGNLGKYTRVVLRNGEGTSNPGPNEIGTVIRSSMTLHGIEGAIDLGIVSIPDDPTSNLGLEMIADKR